MENNKTFTDEEIKNFIGFGEALRKVHNRLVSEGKLKKDKNGKWIFLDKSKNWIINKVKLTLC